MSRNFFLNNIYMFTTILKYILNYNIITKSYDMYLGYKKYKQFKKINNLRKRSKSI